MKSWWLVHCWRCELDRLVLAVNDPSRFDRNGNTGRDPCENCGSLWVTTELQPDLEHGRAGLFAGADVLKGDAS